MPAIRKVNATDIAQINGVVNHIRVPGGGAGIVVAGFDVQLVAT